jgi:putative oxidoreductase
MVNFNNRTALALTLLRVATGAIFVAHGAQKVLGLFGGPGLEGFAQWSATLGIPAWLAYAAAFAELIGGLLLISSIGAPLGALLSGAVMLGAIWFVHLEKGFFAQNGGYEYALLLLLNCIVIFLASGNCWPLASCSTKGKKDSCC